MAIIPDAIERISVCRLRPVARKHDMGDILQIANIWRGDNTAPAWAKNAMNFPAEFDGIQDVLNRLIGDDDIGQTIRQWEQAIQVRLAELPAVRLAIPQRIQARSGDIQTDALIESFGQCD
ncbi:hypothetical protein DSC_07600 [Pseudoxanthomonas spadix BD-a59]|uniref:Uncharacterized protein n=1 Tax=Pseudoxanthomonas spadix (strain BD-a59) TaxID=1045855 RepID=G7UTR8_PSEUP|nr:hypothetical protein DSC_07600 [Pseudoxanthomonas spadix BD-a59]